MNVEIIFSVNIFFYNAKLTFSKWIILVYIRITFQNATNKVAELFLNSTQAILPNEHICICLYIDWELKRNFYILTSRRYKNEKWKNSAKISKHIFFIFILKSHQKNCTTFKTPNYQHLTAIFNTDEARNLTLIDYVVRKVKVHMYKHTYVCENISTTLSNTSHSHNNALHVAVMWRLMSFFCCGF